MKLTRLLIISALLLAPVALPAQQNSDAAQNPSQALPKEPVLQPNPLDVLRKFEGPADQEYRLGPGDQIAIDIPGHPELSQKLVLGPDGRITLPLAGNIDLGNKTREEAAAVIDTALSQYYNNIRATVSVEKYTSNRVLVIGAVNHPGLVQFDAQPTLLEALAKAGLPGSTHNSSNQVATLGTAPSAMASIPERCAVYRGRNEVVWVNLRKLLREGNSMADLRLRRGDVVFVPNPQDNFVSVLGEVQHPGAVQLTPDMTLANVLALAGGLNTQYGAAHRIEVLDPSAGKKTILPFKDVLANKGNAAELTLKSGDVIFVPRSGFYKVTNTLNAFSPLTSLFTYSMLTYHP
jgi:polysaccharide export outer membrane protein